MENNRFSELKHNQKFGSNMNWIESQIAAILKGQNLPQNIPVICDYVFNRRTNKYGIYYMAF